MVWVDATGLVLGPARSHSDGYYVDVDGGFWGTNRITGEVEANDGYGVVEELFTGLNCTGDEFVAGTQPMVAMEVAGRLVMPPVTAPMVDWDMRSQRIDGICSNLSFDLYCDQWTACWATSEIATWPTVPRPGPFTPPLHAEWR